MMTRRYLQVLILALTSIAFLPAPTAHALPPCSMPGRVHVEAHTTIDKIGHVRLLALVSVAVPDAITSITFGTMRQAHVLVAGQVYTSGQALILPAGTTAVELLVERTAQGGGTLVPFTVHDGCGSWPSFVGGGATAF